MFLIGLTGGIASGKSTVAKRWVEHGATEIDADLLAREVVAPGSSGLEQLTQTFGSEILNTDGTLDRAKLGALVFGDEAKRLALTAAEAAARVAAQAKPIERAAVADVILNSNQDINLLLRDADQLWREIEQRAEAKNNG